MTDRPRRRVVADAGPLIHLDELGALDLLADFSSVVVAEVVRREVERHRPELWPDEAVTFTFETAEPAPTPALAVLVETFSLDRGEQAALSLAQR